MLNFKSVECYYSEKNYKLTKVSRVIRQCVEFAKRHFYPIVHFSRLSQCSSGTLIRFFLIRRATRNNGRQPLNAVKSFDDNADLAAHRTRAITSGLLSRDVLLQVSPRDFYTLLLTILRRFPPPSSFHCAMRLSSVYARRVAVPLFPISTRLFSMNFRIP